MKKIEKLSLLLLLVISSISCKQKNQNYFVSSGGKHVEFNEFDNFIKSAMVSMKIPGLDIAIINDSKLVYHQTFGVTNTKTNEKINKKTIFEAASFSKPLFAYFVMKQVEKGLIDLDKPLYKYLPYPDIEHDDRYKLITARMVLSHQSGFPNDRFNEPDKKLNLAFTPGTAFLYSGEGYHYLSKVVAHVNKVHESKLDSIFQKEVAVPLQAAYLTYNWNDSIANYKAYGHKKGKPTHNNSNKKFQHEFGAASSLHTNVANYSKFLLALLKKEGLSEKSFKELFAIQVNLPEDNVMRRVGGFTSWSLGFSVQKSSGKTLYAHFGNNGHFTSYFNIYPETKSGIIIFSNSEAIMHTDFLNKLGEFLGEDIKCDVLK